MGDDNQKPVCMTKEYWENSQLSIARRYGRIGVFGYEYVIVNKEGKDIWRAMAIAAGEPADLCRRDFVPLYRKLGRDRFLGILKDNRYASDKELKKIMQAEAAKAKKP